MFDERLLLLAAEYRNRGIPKYGELLLDPNDALELLMELTQLEVLVIGCGCWKYVEWEEQTAYELPGGGCSPELEIPFLEMTPTANAAIITKFIREREFLNYQFDLIAFRFNELEVGYLFSGE